ncbi:acylphosphatase [Candidatus Woesearchaeota archaeon]|nr:acylphosphatase [Candidatus Woesearchaeota archaeon]
MKQIRMVIRGRVQGVFFRKFVQDTAVKLGLSGFARNLQGGEVEVVAKGPDGMLQELIRACQKGPMLARVEDIRVEEDVQAESHSGFEIK